MRFQIIAPMRADIMRSWAELKSRSFTALGSTRPPVMVLATAWPVSAPTKLRTAAIPIAAAGLRTRVATTVAMALAVSWKPFMKSKATAKRTTRMSSVQAMKPRSGILDYQPTEHVGDVFGFVGSLFHLGVDVAPLDDVEHVLRAGE